MQSIVVHYKELALKGKNRPWFIQILVRNLRRALKGLDVQAVRSVMGRIEIELGAEAPQAEVRDRISRVFGIANFSYGGRAPLEFSAIAAAILQDLGDRRPNAFRVSARRSDKRFPYTSPQIEREVGGLIKQANEWKVDLSHPDLTIHIEMLPHAGFLFLRQGTRSRRPADRFGGTGGVPALRRDRLAGRGVPHDAARLLGAADSLSQLPDFVARFTGEGS